MLSSNIISSSSPNSTSNGCFPRILLIGEECVPLNNPEFFIKGFGEFTANPLLRTIEICQHISQGIGFNFRNCKHREAPSNSTSFFCSSDKIDNPSASFENHLNFSQLF